MNISDKYFQQEVLHSDENIRNLWERLHQETSKKYSNLTKTRTKSFRDFKVSDLESDNDFMEVWIKIEESIRKFEMGSQSKMKNSQI
jgi:hypothetical protein